MSRKIKTKNTDEVMIKYRSDYNIFDLHSKIKQNFIHKKSNLPELKKSLSDLQKSYESPGTVVVKNRLFKQIEELTIQIKRIEEDIDEKEYDSQSEQYLKSYSDIGNSSKTVVFGRKSAVDNEPKEEQEYRLRIIMRYFEVASKYFSFCAVREVKASNACDECGNKLEDEDDVKICNQCGLEKVTLMVLKKNDISNDYEDEENFKLAFLRYNGVGHIDSKMKEAIFSDLNRYFSSYEYPIGEDVSKGKVDEYGMKHMITSDGKVIQTSIDMMIRALSHMKYSAYYDNVYLICHLYWGWILPSLGHLEETLISDYRKTQVVFRKIPKERKSSINLQYRLFKQLEMRGHKCKKSQFKMVKTEEILQGYDTIWKQMCEGANDPEIKFIPTV